MTLFLLCHDFLAHSLRPKEGCHVTVLNVYLCISGFFR